MVNIMSLELNRAEIKELVGKRVTINGERHRVEKVLISKRTLTTDKGKTISVDDLYRKGRGFFADFDEPKAKGKAKAEPTSRRKKKVVEEDTTAPRRGRTRRKVVEEEEAPVSRRKKKVVEEAPVSRNRKAKRIQRDTTLDMDDYTPKKVKTIKVPSFDQKIADKIATLMTEKGIEFIKEHLGFDLSLIATSATYNNTINTVTLTLGKTGMSDKEIIEIRNKDAYIDDVSSEDDTDDLEEFEPEELDDLEEDDLEDEEDDLEDEDDDLEGDIEDDEDGDLEEDEEDEDDIEEDEEEVGVAVAGLVESILEIAPDLNEDKVQNYVENYLASDEVEEHFGDEMCPGASYLSEKGKSLEFLLVGLDSETNMIRLLNLKTLKFRSKSIEDVVHMELLDK